MRIDKHGIEFSHRGDDVLWLWPWRREKWSRRYISFGFDGVFSTLRELDKLWEDYFAAQRRRRAMVEWARVWKSVAKRWRRQARASWAVEALWVQERQVLRECIVKMNATDCEQMTEYEERIRELEEIVEVYEDKDFFDALAKTVITQLRRERDECRAGMVRAHKLLVQDLEAVFPLAGEDVEQAKRAMLDAVKDYVRGL